MKKLFLFAVLSFFIPTKINLLAQDFDVPLNYSFNTKDDYQKYESDVLKCIDYLESVPFDETSDKVKNANKFLLQWLTGTPNVSIKINSYILDLCEKNSGLLMIFMGGWAKYSLTNSYDKDEFKGNISGIESVIKVYQNGKGIKKDKKILKVIKLKEEGKLENWLNEQLAKANKK